MERAISGQDAFVMVDPDQLRQLVDHLAQNACDAMARQVGGGPPDDQPTILLVEYDGTLRASIRRGLLDFL